MGFQMLLDEFSWAFLLAAFGVAVVHTAIGPDHYLPFVALAHARRWTRRRMLGVTAACGLAHVSASVALGAALLLVGASLGALEVIDQGRTALVAYGLVAAGIAYAVWGFRRTSRALRRISLHEHGGHVHLHAGAVRGHSHAHGLRNEKTFWALFAIFVLGPCEPLIPLMLLAAASGRWTLAGATTLVFAGATVLTMVLIVGAIHSGVRRFSFAFLDRWAHTTAGIVLAGSGLTILLGL